MGSSKIPYKSSLNHVNNLSSNIQAGIQSISIKKRDYETKTAAHITKKRSRHFSSIYLPWFSITISFHGVKNIYNTHTHICTLICQMARAVPHEF